MTRLRQPIMPREIKHLKSTVFMSVLQELEKRAELSSVIVRMRDSIKKSRSVVTEPIQQQQDASTQVNSVGLYDGTGSNTY